MKTKLIFIGPIKDNGGSGVKNKLLLERFNELFDKVIAIDTANWRKRPWIVFQILWAITFCQNAKVVVSASRSSSHLFKFLYFFPIKKDIYCWVIGGSHARLIKQGIYSIDSQKKIKMIIVEGQKMVHELHQLGIENTICVPNFKPVYTINKTKRPTESVVRFVFLSRIHPDKGIKEIINACKVLNEKGYSKKYSVDFYGPIYNGYEEEFAQLIGGVKNVNYKGFLNLKDKSGYEELAQYDVMLFPTYWDGEGFPGIVIDAYIAGLPIIATDWNLNSEVIKEGETGVIIPVRNSYALAEQMGKFINGKYNLKEMSSHCLEYAKLYDYKQVINKELLKKIELL